ncbi:zinc finger, DHHC-type containing 17, isoform CRA_d [Tribonema minus]|uniref:Palmitoyltransferase n=1 Tax=Tribonema minus TaxID=303371 RepID=A0A836CB60_9STRA|nr:zinc finger, DHHC-type containing 17, isoform CRA_d [Tribonema minus]
MAKAVDAARYGSLDKLRCLMEEAPVAARIAPNQKDREDITMLHWAAINNRLLVVRYLLSHGADPRLPGGVLKETALQWAARQGHLEVVMELLRVGTDPEHPNVYGQNALHLACQLERVAVAMVLLASGVPADARDYKGFTPLMYSVKLRGNCLDLARVLLAFGASDSLDAVDSEEGNTALHWAVMSSFGPQVMLNLIKAGARLDVANKMGLTAETLARSQGMYMAASFLGNAATLPRRVEDVPLARGALLFPLQAAAAAACVAWLGWWGVLAALVAAALSQPLARRVAHHPANRYALGLAAGSVGAVWAAFTLGGVAREAPAAAALAFQLSVAATLYWLRATCVADPGVVRLGAAERAEAVLSAAAAGGAPALGPREFCATCAAPRAPRSKHCEVCGGCVRGFDHHCPFVGNCVGARNRRAFLLFLACAVVGLTLFLRLALQWGAAGGTPAAAAAAALRNGPRRWYRAVCAVFVRSRAVGCALALAALHTPWIASLLVSQGVMVARDRTTYECVKSREWVARRGGAGGAAGGRCCSERCLPRWLVNCAEFWLGRAATAGSYAQVPTELLASACERGRCCDSHDHGGGGGGHSHAGVQMV